MGIVDSLQELGIDLYIREPGESIEELDQRQLADHFGRTNKAMAELEELAGLAGASPIVGWAGEEWISPNRAAEIARKLRAFLLEIEPGPRGSATDEEMCATAAEFASFCERAAEQNGFVVW